MKKGRTIEELASELVAIQDSKIDLSVPTSRLHMSEKGLIAVTGNDVPERIEGTHFNLTSWAHSQVSQYTNIPKGYYDRILGENPGLLAASVNHGLQMAINLAVTKRKEESRMLRTVNGRIRGFLSSRYRRLDCADLLEAVLPVLNQHQFNVVSCELTERRMYLKVTTDRIQGEVKKGMVVQYGLVISSSDVGCGSVRVEPLMYECICDNGQICDTALRKFHIGKDQASDNIHELLSDKTKEMADEVFWRSVHDVVISSIEEVNFERELNKLREAAEVPIKNMNLEKVVDLTMKEVGISGENKKHNILEYLANGAQGRGLNKWGLANSFTWAAQAEDVDYEECTELERAGGKIILLPQNKWDLVAGK